MSRLFCIVVVAGLALASANKIGSNDAEWAEFKKTHNKEYDTAVEHDYRFQVFAENMDFARTSNAQAKPYTLGATKFADLTHAEFKAYYLGAKVQPKKSTVDAATWELKDVSAPAQVDWRTKGAVTPVKNQGQCGSCWAFSTTGSTEGANVVGGNSLISLSEQELVDCAGSTGNMGCRGGLMDNAFKWIIQNGGINTEKAYPYTAQDGQCKENLSKKDAVVIASYQDVPQDNEDALQKAVASQPVSVAIEADQQVFQMYTGGIIDDTACGTNLDHGVLAVGYCQGTNCKDVSTLSKGDGYWLVKNSWSDSWGEQGYVRIAMHGGSSAGICGIASDPSYPTVGGSPSPGAAPSPSPSNSPSPSPSPSNSPSPSPAPGPSGPGCPSGTCPSSATCCSMNDQNTQWGCCPLENAVCCNDHQHCCPSGTTCDVADGRCLNANGAVASKFNQQSLMAALNL